MACNNSSSVFLNHYRTLRNKQEVDLERLGSENDAIMENTSSHLNDTAGVAAVAVAASSCGFIFHESLISRLSAIRPIPWYLTERQVKVLVHPST